MINMLCRMNLPSTTAQLYSTGAVIGGLLLLLLCAPHALFGALVSFALLLIGLAPLFVALVHLPPLLLQLCAPWGSRWGSLAVLGSLILSAGGTATPTVALQVQVRTPAGQPLPGVTLSCAPQAAGLGGPRLVPPPATQTVVTGPDGRTTCPDLAAGIWVVGVIGSVAGVPVQPLAAQGQLPYGRTRAGGGFVVALDPTGGEEGAALLTPRSGPLTADLALVGQVRAGVWVPELDRQTGGGLPTPQSLLPVAGVAPTLDVGAPVAVPPTPTRPPAAATGVGGSAGAGADSAPPPLTPAGIPPWWLVFWIPVGLAGAGMLLRWAWLQWRGPSPHGRG